MSEYKPYNNFLKGKKWTAEEEEELMNLLEEGKSFKEISKELNRSKKSVTRKYQRCQARKGTRKKTLFSKGKGDELNKICSSKYTQNSAEIEINIDKDIKEGDVDALNQLLTENGVDMKKWTVDKWYVGKYQQGSKIDGRVQKTNLKTIRASLVRRKPDQITAEEHAKKLIAALGDDFKSQFPGTRIKKNKNNKFMLEINPVDIHFGLLAWEGETGLNYNSKIAKARLYNAIKTIIKDIEHFGLDYILIPVGNDFFNADNLHGTTSKGTPQDNDGRWQRTMIDAEAVWFEIIEYCRDHAPVKILHIPGNHDTENSFHLCRSIKHYFRQCDDVEVDTSASPRKYVKYGQCLLGLTHGDKEKRSELPLLMSQEQPKLWGDTVFREWHLGHEHRSKTVQTVTTDEYKGVMVRNLRSLARPSSWIHSKGFIGVASIEAFMWHKDRGMTMHLMYNLNDFKENKNGK